MALIVKALRVPALPPIVPIPTLPLNKVVIAVEVATPVENKKWVFAYANDIPWLLFGIA